MDVAELYRTEAPKLRSYFRLRLSERERHRAEDLAADVFVRLLSAASDYRRRTHSNARGLVWVIARNLLIDHYQSLAVRAQVLSFDLAQHDRADPSATAELDAVTDGNLLALYTLTPEQRLALDAKYLRGESWQQAADRLGITVSGLKKLRSRAIDSIRRQMTREGAAA